ncbi:hypothetical protein CHS0354_026836 [Potamilus streckersoni]|uniref:Uncharacterized protein n=1 Tax=Potamilus streckersoni TaxID=2493646 RepID=A0AAE0W8F0_9BIVA|nr:hypothetical protein CHS0354_026836 [Potamilus streckersoni]
MPYRGPYCYRKWQFRRQRLLRIVVMILNPAHLHRLCVHVMKKAPTAVLTGKTELFTQSGIGVPNPKLETDAQKNFSAVRAATVVAQRNLLETIQGIQITSNTTVESGIAQNDTIVTRLEGTLKRSQAIGKPSFLNDGSVSVVVRYFMSDLNALLVSRDPYGASSGSKSQGPDPYGKKSGVYEPKSAGGNSPNKEMPVSSAQGGTYSGLIVDARGLNIKPALSPKVLDGEGNVVYGVERTDRSFNISQGIVGYAKNPESAKNNTRIKGNPLTVKAVKASGNASTDVVVSKEDSENLLSLYESQSFLREGRVIVLVD